MDQQLQTKTALGVKQPVRANDNVIVYLPSSDPSKEYDKARTFVKEIVNLRCENNIYYITLKTKNSLYQDIPLNIYIKDIRYNGQVLSAGSSVMVADGSWKTISEIAGIEDNTLFVRDTAGNLFKAGLVNNG